MTMLFNFALRPVAEVGTWGDDHSLHWFGLTEGWYWMSVGEATLFEFTDDTLASDDQPDHPQHARYVDYYVARLWEDVRDLLPDALEPIPSDVIVERRWAERLAGLYYGTGPSGPMADFEAAPGLSEAVEGATLWWGMRRLDTGYLRSGPLVHIWRVADTVHIGWDNRRRQFNGAQSWTAELGEVTFPIGEFMTEVVAFRRRLAEAMRARIDQVLREGPPPGVKIDFDLLVAEQVERFDEPKSRLAKSTPMDWDRVRDAICDVRRILPGLA